MTQNVELTNWKHNKQLPWQSTMWHTDIRCRVSDIFSRMKPRNIFVLVISPHISVVVTTRNNYTKPERHRQRKQLSLAFSVNVHNVTTYSVNVVPNICAIFLFHIRHKNNSSEHKS